MRRVLAALGLIIVACKADKPAREESVLATGPAPVALPAPPVLEGRVEAVAMDVAPQASRSDRQALASDRAAAAGTAGEIAPSMMIRTGRASIEVDRLDPAIERVRKLAAAMSGYIANTSITGGRDQVRSATLEMKIPAASYDQVIGGLGGVGKIESVNTSAEDVGEEYVDISARVNNSKRLEERLINILATRTGRLQDVLSVERELARVREEIERYEGRMRFLRTRAAMSTLSVTVHEPFPILGKSPGDNPIVIAVRQAWRNFVALVSGIIASLGVVVPLGAILAAGWYGYRRYWRRA